MKKPKIKITLIDKAGKYGCHRGHKVGDTFDYDIEAKYVRWLCMWHFRILI